MSIKYNKSFLQFLVLPALLVSIIFSYFVVANNDLLFLLPKAEGDVTFYKDSSNPPFLFFFNSYDNKEFMCFQRENREAGEVDKSVPWDAWLINKTENCTDTWNWYFNRVGTTPNLPADKSGYVNLCRTPQYDQTVCLSKVRPQQPTPTPQPDTDLEPSPTLTPTPVPADNQGSNSTSDNTSSNPTPTSASVTNTAQLCFYNTAEIYINCLKTKNNCVFSTHIKFNNDDSSLKNTGDIKLERSNDGKSFKHIAGPNKWEKDSLKFNYSPEWTGGDVMLNLDKDNSATIYWKGKFNGCVGSENKEIEDMLECEFSVNGGLPSVKGSGCYVKDIIVEHETQKSSDSNSGTSSNSNSGTSSNSNSGTSSNSSSGTVSNSNSGSSSGSNSGTSSNSSSGTASNSNSGSSQVDDSGTSTSNDSGSSQTVSCLANCFSTATVETAVRRCVVDNNNNNYRCIPQVNLCSNVSCRGEDEGVLVSTKYYKNEDSSEEYLLYNSSNCSGQPQMYRDQRTLEAICGKTKRNIRVSYEDYRLDLNHEPGFSKDLKLVSAYILVIQEKNGIYFPISDNIYLYKDQQDSNIFGYHLKNNFKTISIEISKFSFLLTDKYRINPENNKLNSNNFVILNLEFDRNISNDMPHTIFILIGRFGYKTSYVFSNLSVVDLQNSK
ncbi:MAG: hypothetical protein KatS3mg090_0612 [Patescibacteria group bacterium]|nr:MAG: hypothetical protein KatS3mg090_0612 [Patescibacteria group bacterium]